MLIFFVLLGMPAGTHIINTGTAGKQLYTVVSNAGGAAGMIKINSVFTKAFI